MQVTDPETGRLIQMFLNNTRPEVGLFAAESDTAKELLSQWQQLCVRDGLVYREWLPKNGCPVMQLIIPASYRQKFLRQVHAGLTGGHFGVRKTLDQVQRRAYWPHWRADTRRFVRQCEVCQTYHRGKLPRTAHLQPLMAGAPMEKIHFDLTGPHPRSRRGSVYILTCICPFTKWAEAFPLPNKEAPTVARILVEQVICRYGTPIGALSDRGREVDGTLMNEICHRLGIDKMRTTAYKPSTNAQVERFHGTLNAIMAKTVNENQNDWDLQLPYVMAAYRASRHEATGMTPNYLMLGREVRAPVDLMFGAPEESTPVTYDSYADELDQRMRNAYALVRDHLGEAACRNKKQYDLRVRPQKFSKGDWVWYFNPRRAKGKQEKWRRKYTGPFLIIRIIGPVNAVLQKSKRAKPFCVHIDKIKHLNAEEYPASWLDGDDEGGVLPASQPTIGNDSFAAGEPSHAASGAIALSSGARSAATPMTLPVPVTVSAAVTPAPAAMLFQLPQTVVDPQTACDPVSVTAVHLSSDRPSDEDGEVKNEDAEIAEQDDTYDTADATFQPPVAVVTDQPLIDTSSAAVTTAPLSVVNTSVGSPSHVLGFPPLDAYFPTQARATRAAPLQGVVVHQQHS